MGEYWSVDECRWVSWPSAAKDDPAEVPQPREAVETDSAPVQR